MKPILTRPKTIRDAAALLPPQVPEPLDLDLSRPSPGPMLTTTHEVVVEDLIRAWDLVDREWEHIRNMYEDIDDRLTRARETSKRLVEDLRGSARAMADSFEIFRAKLAVVEQAQEELGGKL